MTTPFPSRPTFSALVCGLIALLGLSCGGSDKSSPEETGRSCTPTAEAPAGTCFSDLKESIKGEAVCMTRVPEGYCTHTCQTDSDCCAVKGECKTGIPQVCAPFESAGEKYCFLSCEPEVIASVVNDPNDPATDDTVYCQENANAAFICRSTGGGNQNRKVCVPNG